MTGPRPPARDVGVSGRMSRQRRRDTGPELALRSLLHRHGLRYRIHRRVLPGLRREADLVFPSAKVAVFVDGCFWHGCPEHVTWPKSNQDWWRAKLLANRKRDAETDRHLVEAGWCVVRVWEHETTSAAAARVEDAVRSRVAPPGRRASKL